MYLVRMFSSVGEIRAWSISTIHSIVAYWGEDKSSSASLVDTCKSTSRTASYLCPRYSEGFNVIGGYVGMTSAGGVVGPSVMSGGLDGTDEVEFTGPDVGASDRARH